MADRLFDTIERWQGVRPWGRMLDAGTGAHSLRWIRGLETTGWTAVTGDQARERNLRRDLGTAMRPTDAVVTGNWSDELFLSEQRFETVLADYLLGALDGFAPYHQDQLFSRLRRHVSGRLYVVGLEPYPDGIVPGMGSDRGRQVDPGDRATPRCLHPARRAPLLPGVPLGVGASQPGAVGIRGPGGGAGAHRVPGPVHPWTDGRLSPAARPTLQTRMWPPPCGPDRCAAGTRARGLHASGWAALRPRPCRRRRAGRERVVLIRQSPGATPPFRSPAVASPSGRWPLRSRAAEMPDGRPWCCSPRRPCRPGLR